MTATASGYVLVAADGGVFAFGGARYAGSLAGRGLNAPIVGIAATPDGYLLVGSDGGVFAFGAAPMFGSMSGGTGGRAIVGIVADGDGYVIEAGDGVRYSFTLTAHGVEGSDAVDAPIVGIA